MKTDNTYESPYTQMVKMYAEGTILTSSTQFTRGAVIDNFFENETDYQW